MREATLQTLGYIVQDFRQLAGTIRDDTAEVLGTGDHIAIIRHFDNLRRANEQIKEAREALQQIADTLSSVNIPDVMRLAGVKTVTIEGVGRVTVSYRYSCSMIDKEQGIAHLRSIGQGGLVQETINSSTLAAFAKNLLEEEGKELPAEIFKVGTNPFTSITKVK